METMSEAKSKLRYLLGREPKDAEAEWMRDQLAAAREEGAADALRSNAHMDEEVGKAMRRAKTQGERHAVLSFVDALGHNYDELLVDPDHPLGEVGARAPLAVYELLTHAEGLVAAMPGFYARARLGYVMGELRKALGPGADTIEEYRRAARRPSVAVECDHSVMQLGEIRMCEKCQQVVT